MHRKHRKNEDQSSNPQHSLDTSKSNTGTRDQGIEDKQITSEVLGLVRDAVIKE